MKTFKEFSKSVKKKKTSWLSWDQPHDNHSDVKNESTIIESWETDSTPTEPVKNKLGGVYDSLVHDHPDIKPQELSNDHIREIERYVSDSSNVNGHLRDTVAGKKSSFGPETLDKIKQRISTLSSAFTRNNTNRKRTDVYSGIPRVVGKTLSNSKPWSEHRLAGFVSASTNKETALGFAKSKAKIEKDPEHQREYHVLHMRLHPGSGLFVGGLSPRSENEAIIHHNTRVKYHGTKSYANSDGTVTHVHSVEVFNNHD